MLAPILASITVRPIAILVAVLVLVLVLWALRALKPPEPVGRVLYVGAIVIFFLWLLADVFGVGGTSFRIG